jgi:hypothetical protein
MLHARGVCRLARFLDLDARRRGEMRVRHGARVAPTSGLKAKDFRCFRRRQPICALVTPLVRIAKGPLIRSFTRREIIWSLANLG